MTHRVLNLILLLVASWCTFTVTHELGHILAGICCGAKLQMADILPWHLPLSIFEPDPIPLLTLWGGPILGVVVPLIAAASIRHPWIRFVANFCLLANGVYIAAAWLTGDRYLDTARMLEHGAHPISLAIYCITTIGFGYAGFRASLIGVLFPTLQINGPLGSDQPESLQ